MPDDVEIVEGTQSLTPDGKGAVPLTKYIGVKEMLGKEEKAHTETKETLTVSQTKVTGLETEVKNLGEQLKQAKESGVDPEKVKALEKERDDTKAELETKKTQELTTVKESLTKAGYTEEDLKEKSSSELTLLMKGLEKGQGKKPGADLGTGTGSGVPPASAREAMKSAFDELHPSDK